VNAKTITEYFMMHQTFLSVRSWAIYALLLIALVSCITAPTPVAQDTAATVNVVQEANLRQTTQLAILAVEESSGNYSLVAQLDDPAVITAAVDALDQALPLVPAVRCIDQYRLRFTLADGAVHEFGYRCQGGESFLQGGPGFLQGHAVQPPETLWEVLRAHLGTGFLVQEKSGFSLVPTPHPALRALL
jgi:hypothetical protein